MDAGIIASVKVRHRSAQKEKTLYLIDEKIMNI